MSTTAHHPGSGGLVCLTSSEPPLGDGHGSPGEVSELASWLHGRGWQVEIVTGRRRPGRDVTADVPADLLRSWEQRRWPQGLDEASSVVAGMAFRLRRFAPWLVHAFLAADAAAAALADRPYVVSYGGMIQPEVFTGHPQLWQLFQLVSRGARQIICPSVAAADHLEAMYGLRAEVVPPGVDTARFADLRVPQQPGLILAPGSADDPQARLPLLFDAFAEVARQRPDAELAVIGPGRPDAVRELLGRLPAGVASRVRPVGPVDRQRQAAWYARAAVTCVPGVRQGFPQALVESLAAGTPVVAANDGGAPEIVTPEVGVLFTADDTGACARRLLDTLDLSADAATAALCHRRAAEFDWDAVGPRLVELYQRVA